MVTSPAPTALSDFGQTGRCGRATVGCTSTEHRITEDGPVIEDFERCYRAVLARDERFDGWFFTGVRTTRIYCRPSCPARTPKPEHVDFFPSAAAAQRAGLRACKRCRPDASPGSPEWNQRSDVVARAMRHIAEGVIDREGVSGLARRLGYSTRQLNRLVTSELGAGPLALARAQRAQTARVLIETTDLPFASIAFAAGFESVRQFNETVRTIFAGTPTELRRGRRAGRPATDQIELRLPVRAPYDATSMLGFLAERAVPGIEQASASSYARTLRLPHGSGVVECTPAGRHINARLHLDDLRDLAPAVERFRRLLDLDADGCAIVEQFAADPLLGPLVRENPGQRVAGTVDPHELAIRAVIGQQVSVRAARSVLGRLVSSYGKPVTSVGTLGDGALTHLFPDTETIASLDPTALPMPRRRAHAVITLARALADGALDLDRGTDPERAQASLLALPGIGRWTAGCILMRGLGHPDVMLVDDLGVQRALGQLRGDATTPGARAVAEASHGWRPWRSYAVAYLWSSPAQRALDAAVGPSQTVAAP
jgi:AraC family transcriptional regulator of adaptative response / DNA-3-methyladenine glycosylase II